MFFEQLRKGGANLVGDLKQQRTGEAILEIGRDEAADMAEVVPDRALQQIAFQSEECRRREQVVEPHRAGLLLLESLHQRVAVRPVADRGTRQAPVRRKC